MTLTEITLAVMNRLQDANARLLADGEYEEVVLEAVVKYSTYRPRIRRSSVLLSAGVDTYPAPEGFQSIYLALWGKDAPAVPPWQHCAPPAIPDVFLVAEQLFFTPTPTPEMLSYYGASFPFLYRAPHVLTDSASTIRPGDDPLIILLGASYAAKEIAALPNQADAFINRYAALGKRYWERFEEMMKNPTSYITRS